MPAYPTESPSLVIAKVLREAEPEISNLYAGAMVPMPTLPTDVTLIFSEAVPALLVTSAMSPEMTEPVLRYVNMPTIFAAVAAVPAVSLVRKERSAVLLAVVLSGFLTLIVAAEAMYGRIPVLGADTSSSRSGAVVPMPTLPVLVLVMLVPLVAHWACTPTALMTVINEASAASAKPRASDFFNVLFIV